MPPQIVKLLKEFDKMSSGADFFARIKPNAKVIEFENAKEFISKAYSLGHKQGLEQAESDYLRTLPELLKSAQASAKAEMVKLVEGMKTDERKVAVFGEWQAESYNDKQLVNAVLTDILAALKGEEK